MTSDFDPYRPPSPESKPEPSPPRLAFGQAIGRGFSVANQTWVGMALMLLILGPSQIAGAVSAAMMLQGALQVEPGQPPSPQMMTMIGVGCVSCLWLPVIIFGLPWVVAGTVGRICDRILPTAAVGSFQEHGRRHYGRMLLLLLIFIAVMVVLYVPVYLVSSIIMAQQMPAGQFDMEKIQALSRHPANIAMGVVFGLIMLAVGVVFNLCYAAVVAEGQGPVNGLGRAFSFCRQFAGDAVKLYFVYFAVVLPIILVQQVGAQVVGENIVGLVAISVIYSILLAYISVLNLGFGASVYLNRRTATDEPFAAGTGPAAI